MRKITFVAVAALSALLISEAVANSSPPPPPPPPPVSSNTYNLLVHGRSGDDHCVAISGVNSATNDKNGYWSGSTSNLSNVRYVGFEGTKNGGAQRQMHDAVQTWCTGSNQCNIYTHSTGGLVAAYYFYASGSAGTNILDVRLMANASGGSELADISTDYLSWLGFDTLGGELDESVSTSGARGWNHNDTAGLVFALAGGESSDYLGVTSPFLPGYDDGVLANHSLCGMNKVDTVDRSCPYGSGNFSESYSCGFLWLSNCTRNHTRFSNHNTVYVRGGDTHSDAKEHYNK